jgi:ApbE superfamily uncharacterized protein (UPF0280 family)
MVSTTGEHFAYFELDTALRPVACDLPAALTESVERIKENCEPALVSVLFMGGAGGSLRAGRRLHLQDGPIDLIIEAFGRPDQVRRAWRAAIARLTGLLDGLCAELPVLRAPAGAEGPVPVGDVAGRMRAAVLPLMGEGFITPMAAVAGAVADAVLAAMVAAAGLDRAYVNNGGDIAVFLAQGQQVTCGMVDRPDRPSLVGTARLTAADPVRGIATSGWRGRSFSLGIADAVTVLADTAAAADAAATVVANAVDLPGMAGIVRVPAVTLDPDSDLGRRCVTRAVPVLDPAGR